MPILMFGIAFGLSMDYEVFLLSRIREEHARTGDNRASVATGLERTGRIVSAAAALLAITFLAFGTADVGVRSWRYQRGARVFRLSSVDNRFTATVWRSVRRRLRSCDGRCYRT